MASSSPPPSDALKRTRRELKEWEHTFHRLHGRSPSKSDIHASPSIHALYRQYALLKLKARVQPSNCPEPCGPEAGATLKEFVSPSSEIDIYNTMSAQPGSPGAQSSCSDGSHGTHISATPPRKKVVMHASTGPAGRDSSTKGREALATFPNRRPSSSKQASRVFRDITRASHNSQEGQVMSAHTSTQGLDCRKLKVARVDIAAKQMLSGETSNLGFKIKMQRLGERDKENTQVENLPAGFFVNPISSLGHGVKPFSHRILAGDPEKILGNTETSALEVLMTETEAIQKSSHGTSGVCRVAIVENDLAGGRGGLRGVDGKVLDVDKIAVDAETVSLWKRTVQDLREMLVGRGLLPSGNKRVLIARLVQASSGKCDASAFCDDSTIAREAPCSSDVISDNSCKESLVRITVPALRKVLPSKGLSASGNKTDLVARLFNFNSCNPEYSGAKNAADLEKHKISDVNISKRKTKPCTGNDCSLDNVILNESTLRETPQDEAVLHACTEQPPGRKRGLKVGQSQSLASKRNKVASGSISCVSLRRDRASKKAAGRENFVKLNIGKRGNRAHRFANRGFKGKLGACGHRRRLYSKRKHKKLLLVNADQEVEECIEDAQDMDLDGNLPKQVGDEILNGICPSSLEGPVQAEKWGNALHPGIGKPVSVSLLSDAAEALCNPTESNLLKVLHMLFGFESFRPGQLETIQQTLTGQSTMLVLPTGSGKSLCYQLPAFLLPGITLVVSPLIALMIDQLQHLPPLIPGAVLSSSQTSEEYTSILDRLQFGQLKVLFVSPERFLCDSFLSVLEGLPLISMAVVDEAHCLSEWSHNFRPSYSRLGVILRQKLKLNCLLAMTATATKRTLDSIMQSLSISTTGLVQGSSVQRSLIYTASWSDNRCKDLLSLLQSSPFLEARSIIIYCNFQYEADNLSLILFDNGIQAKSYHGGMTPRDRRHTQELFCSNKLRVVVATIAFGLGLDKGDVGSVIHYGLPNSVEHYVQETGRAGRDGNLAYCHMLLDKLNYLKLRSLAYSDNVDFNMIKEFIFRIFNGSSQQNVPCHINSLPIEGTMKDLDMKEEVMATTLSYLELGEVQYITVLPRCKTTCTLQFHKNFPTHLAKKSFLVDAILKKSQEKHGQYVFDLPSVANFMGLTLSDLQQQLQELQMANEVSFVLKNPAFHFCVLRTPDDLDSLASSIVEWFSLMEGLKVEKLDFMFGMASALTKKEEASQKGSCLQETIQHYFHSDGEIFPCSPPSFVKHSSPFLKADIKVFLQTNSDANFTSRAVARIFHGISSPAYPYSTWSKNHFWGRYTNIDFNAIKEAVLIEQLASHELRSKKP